MRYRAAVSEPFVAVLFAIILVRGSWHASGSGVCNKTSPFLCLSPDFSKSIELQRFSQGWWRVDGPRNPHFARHTRRCATRLFAEALKLTYDTGKTNYFEQLARQVDVNHANRQRNYSVASLRYLLGQIEKVLTITSVQLLVDSEFRAEVGDD